MKCSLPIRTYEVERRCRAADTCFLKSNAKLGINRVWERRPKTKEIAGSTMFVLTKGTIEYEKDWCQSLDHWTGQAQCFVTKANPYAPIGVYTSLRQSADMHICPILSTAPSNCGVISLAQLSRR